MSETNDVFPLIITGANVVPNTNNSRYRLNFPQPINLRNSSVSLGSLSMYYSWPNISSTAYNNNVFQIIHPNGAGYTTITLTLPNGYYSVADINSYLQQQLIANGFYLVDGSGNYVYYCQLITNGTYYSVEFDSFPVPTALPTGFSNPAGFVFPPAQRTPQLVIPSNNNFNKLIGFNAGTYPSVVQATNYSKLSDFTPQISPVQSVILTCSLLQNRYMNPQNVLYSFNSAGSVYGGLVSSAPNFPQFCKVVDGDYSFIEIQFLSQDFNILPIQDPNITVMLVVKLSPS